MKRATAMAVIALALWPAAAAAHRVPMPLYYVVHRAPCPDYAGELVAGCAYGDTGDVFIGTGPQDRFVFWHELGHIFDAQRLGPGDRHWFTRLFRASGPWVGDHAGAESPGEFFADEYAACALGFKVGGYWESGYEYMPTARQYRRFCAALWRLANRQLAQVPSPP